MKSLRLAPQAQADLAEIERYSRETWGDQQTTRYLEGLKLRFEQIALWPELGAECGEVLAGVRRTTIGSHVIFYEDGPDFVLVDRILHRRMDYRRHLSDD